MEMDLALPGDGRKDSFEMKAANTQLSAPENDYNFFPAG